MGNVCKFKLNKRNSIALLSLSNLCVLSASMVNANAMIGRVGNAASSLIRTQIQQSARRMSTLSTTSISLNQRVTALEQQRTIESQKQNHPFNKAIAVGSVFSGAMLVAGVVGGILQTAAFRDMSNRHAKQNEQVQKHLTEKRDEFQNIEVPEAENYIINYYKDNYGIDITKK